MEFNLWEVFQQATIVGKAVFIGLALMSLEVVYLGVERALALRRARRRSAEYAQQLQGLLREGKLQEAAEVSTERSGPLGEILHAGLAMYGETRDAAPTLELLVQSVEEEMNRAMTASMAVVRRGLGTLATIGSIAPFVGLFGTIVGIIRSFRDIGAEGASGLGTVAAGIAEALYATALGIFVAILAVVLFNAFVGRFDAFTEDLKGAGGRLIDAIRRREWSRPVAEGAK